MPAFAMALRAQAELVTFDVPAGEAAVAASWMGAVNGYGRQLRAVHDAAAAGKTDAVTKANAKLTTIGGRAASLSKRLGLHVCFQSMTETEGGTFMKKLIALAAATAAVSLTGLAGTASASPSTTPNGYTGACNMLLDPTMLSVAMQNDVDQGNAGMFHATLLTSGDAYCGLLG